MITVSPASWQVEIKVYTVKNKTGRKNQHFMTRQDWMEELLDESGLYDKSRPGT